MYISYPTDLLHANQTVNLEISSRTETKGTTINCNSDTPSKLEKKLLAHLNDDAKSKIADTTCEFLATGNTSCEMDSIVFHVLLTCAGGPANGNLIDNVKQQQMAIKTIMNRKSSERFTEDVTIIVRLFRESEKRKIPSPKCNDQCVKVQQGPVTLCDCPCKLSMY